MDTISSLEKKLAAARKQRSATDSARFPTGVVIDLSGPEGNVFYILGTCNRLARDFGLDGQEVKTFKEELLGKNYQQILDICQRWFGLIYLNRK